MIKLTKLTFLLGFLVALVSIFSVFVKVSDSKPVWEFVPGSVESGNKFKAIRKGFRKKEYTIKVCEIEDPDSSSPEAIESQKLLSTLLENSEELKLKFQEHQNKNRSIIGSEVYVINKNGEEVSILRELIKSGTIELISRSRWLPGYETCLISPEEIKMVVEARELQQAKRLEEWEKLKEQSKETGEETTIEISESRYRELIETINYLKKERDNLVMGYYSNCRRKNR